MTDDTDQNAARPPLHRISTLHRVMLGILIGYIPLVFLLYLAQLPEWLIIGAAVVLVCMGMVVAFAIGYSRCPACGQFFHVRGMSGNIFVRKCLHCGLPL